jgi:signal peptidase I
MSLKRLIVFAIVMLFGIVMFVFQWRGGLGISYRIPTSSMAPTLPLGSSVIVNPWAYRAAAPQRGEIIVHIYPLQPKLTFVKRVIGVPGDVIEIRDKRVAINGGLIDEPYVVHEDPTVFPRSATLPEPYRSRDQFGPLTVGPDQFFLLGDNRDRSSDSRYYGAVPRNLIRGRVIHIFR